MECLQTVNIVSIFDSIDGEVNTAGAGALTRFIRFAGCNLRCWKDYPAIGVCDTPQSHDMGGKHMMTVGELIVEAHRNWLGKLTITGGEPLLQEDALLALCRGCADKLITIETNGTRLPSEAFKKMPHVRWVMDYKMPSTGHDEDMIDIAESSNFLTHNDFLKMVVADDQDLRCAIRTAEVFRGYGYRGRIAVGPAHGIMDPQVVVDRLLEADAQRAEVYLNVQLHKYLWPNATKEV